MTETEKNYSPQQKIRVGIIGTGAMGRNHLRVVDSIPEFELTCAMDIRLASDKARIGFVFNKIETMHHCAPGRLLSRLCETQQSRSE